VGNVGTLRYCLWIHSVSIIISSECLFPLLA